MVSGNRGVVVVEVIEPHPSRKSSSAFWACSRFSACCQTTDWGPSITSAVISDAAVGREAVHHDGVGAGHTQDPGVQLDSRLKTSALDCSSASWPIDAHTSV